MEENIKEEPVLDSSIEVNTSNDFNMFDGLENEEASEEVVNDISDNNINETSTVNIFDQNNNDFENEKTMEIKGADLLNEFNIFNEDQTERVHEENLYKDSNNITDLFNDDSKDSFDSFDFKALSESIDREYENIFGSSEDIKLDDEDIELKKEESIKEEPEEETFNFFDNTEPVEDIVNVENNEEINNFFKSNNIDFNKFSTLEQEELKEKFNLINYTKTLDILRKNNIRLEFIYGAAKIFEVDHSELESIINKLLIAGQSTLNISYVLNSLPYIKSLDLQDVINSYGEEIKNANITDLIIKAKHLNEIGGGNN